MSSEVSEEIETGPISGPQSAAGNWVIDLPGSLTIACVAELQGQLQKALHSAATITLAGSEVEQIDGAGVQLLIAFIDRANRGSMQWNWREPSASLHRVAKTLGAEQALALAV